jgi:hypothetical protein
LGVKVIEVTETVCAWCGQNVQEHDLAQHMLSCEKQPVVVYRKSLVEALREEYKTPWIPWRVRRALATADATVETYISERKWR